MRKMLLSVVACCAVIAILPASALAHGHHHKGHHRAHHARIRDWGSDQGTGQNQAADAGTVQSFTGGVLTILLNNNQTVSGQVTPDTEIECEAADMSSSLRSHDDFGDNNNSDQGDDDQGPGDDDQGQGDDNNAMCSSSDLTTGTVVHEAELRLSGAGAVWDRVELVTAPTTSTTDTDNGGD